MAHFPGNNVGLTVPGRPSTPCNGRAQHYRRPGDPMKQVTRTFTNGTTLTFGPEDNVSNFREGDAFYEQALSVEAAITDIVAIRQQYQEGGYAAMSHIGGTSQTAGQYKHENVANSSLQDSFARLSIAAVQPHMGRHRKASQVDNHLVTGDKPRNFAKASRRGRRRQNSNQGSRVPNSNVHKDSNKFHHLGPNRSATHNSYGVGGNGQHASNMAAQGPALPAIQMPQSGYHFNPEHASNMAAQGPAPPAIQMPQSDYHFNPEHASNMVAQGPTLHAIQMPQSGYHFNPEHASNMVAQGPALPAIQMPQSGYHFNPEHASNMVAQRHTLPAMQMPQSGFPFNPQHASNMAAQRHALPAMQMPQSGFPSNPQASAWTVAAEPTSRLTARGPTLPAITRPQPRFPINPHVAAVQQSPLMTAHGPTLYATSFPDPNYYGPSFYMTAAQQNRIMTANGIKLPATYIPDPGYYNGPLHWLVAPVAQAIVTAAEGSQHLAFPFYTPRSQLVHDTMLAPCALPPQCYIPGTSQMDIHIAECTRHIELMREVLAVPGKPEHHELPMTWYRILGTQRLRRERPVWHPTVIDLYGQESQYEQLLIRDVNHRNDNEKGVGRKNAPGKQQTQPSATMRVDTVAQKAIRQGASIEGDQGSWKTPVLKHARNESEDTSIFFRDKRTPASSYTNLHYLGYTLRVKRHEEPNPEISPTPPPSRGRSAQPPAGKEPLDFNRSHSATHGEKRGFSATKTPLNHKRCYSGTHEEGESSASKTPLLDFDSRYTAKHGEGDDVDFALRDLGPPRFGGKTFNEKIGFTPSPEKSLGSSSPFGYPMDVPRRPRD